MRASRLPCPTVAFVFLVAAAGACGGGPSRLVSQARGGEIVVDRQGRGTLVQGLPPTLEVVVRTLEPESLPAAAELQDWLADHLRRHRQLFGTALAPDLSPTNQPVDFLIEVQLTHLSPYDTAPRLFWRPIAVKGFGGSRALHASQVPLRAQVTILEGGDHPRVRSRRVLIAQATGRTVTAGTTKPVALLMGEQILPYLKREFRQDRGAER